MDLHAMGARFGDGGPCRGHVLHDSARQVLGVLEDHEAQVGAVEACRPHRPPDRLRGHEAVLRGHHAGHHAREGRHAGDLVVDDVGAGFGQHLVAGTSENANGHGVGHGARRHEDGGLEAEERRGQSLQPVDRGVFPVVVVAHLGLRHGLAHGGRGPSHRVGPQVDGALGRVHGSARLAPALRPCQRAVWAARRRTERVRFVRKGGKVFRNDNNR